MDISIKKLDVNATIPKYAKPGDAGMDLWATSKTITEKYISYGTGLAFEVPHGFVGLLFPRSSVSDKDIVLSNAVGVLDSGYRGEVTFRYKNLNGKGDYNVGDRVGQIIIMPHPEIRFIEVDELSDSERGSGGYGHTGR